MWNAKKSFTIFFSAMIWALASVGTSVSAFAEEAETTNAMTEASIEFQTAAGTETADISLETDIQLNEEDMQKLVDEIQSGTAENETDDSYHDYYADDYYDTDGNATLIKHEQIIYDSEEMQFIAVTTKDGNSHERCAYRLLRQRQQGTRLHFSAVHSGG